MTSYLLDVTGLADTKGGIMSRQQRLLLRSRAPLLAVYWKGVLNETLQDVARRQPQAVQQDGEQGAPEEFSGGSDARRDPPLIGGDEPRGLG